MPIDPTPAADGPTGADGLPVTVAGARRPATAPPVSFVLPDRYECGELLGEGGMGRVYAARDAVLNRRVAVKVLREEIAGPEAEARFRAEARITGQLQHPGVPPVHDLGTHVAGRPFLVMKLIKGRTLADALGERPAPPAEFPRLLQAFEQVCQTVAFAHSHNVIHRDLKPQNVMVGAFGEVQVMDWGLARVVPGHAPAAAAPPDRAETTGASAIDSGRSGDGSSDTRAGSVVGTPAYMPPEQARGEPVDRRADVFALGGILCAILTGQPPYTGTRVEVRAKAELGQVSEALERVRACGAPADLLALAERCLAPRADDRPGDAAAVAEAVAAFRADAEARARRAETDRARAEAQAVEQRKRRRVQFALLAALALLVLGGGAFAWALDRAAQAERQREAEADAEQARVEGELKATQAKADADRRVREAAARAQVPDLLRLATDLRKQYRFNEARAAVAQARAAATGLPELEAATAGAGRDLELVARLDAIRLDRLAVRDGRFDPNRTTAALRACLHEAGFDVVGGTAPDLAARLRASPVRDALVDALDQWALEDRDPALRKRIWDLTADATGQDWRREFPAVRDNPAAVERLAARVPAEEFGSALRASVGMYLYVNGGDGIGFLRRGLILAPNDFWHHTYLAAMAAFAPDRRAEVRGHALAALAIRSDDPLVWFFAAVGHAAAGDAASSQAALAQVKRIDANYKPPVLFEALTQTDPDPDQTLARMGAAVKANPKFAPGWGLIAAAHVKKGDLAAAEAASGRALELDPAAHASAHAALGAEWFKRGDAAAAERCFRAVLRFAPDSASGHLGLGVVLRARGDWIGALPHLREAAFREQTNGLARAYHAQALAFNGFAGGIEEARQAIRLAPLRPEPYLALVAAQFVANDRAGAEDTLRKFTSFFAKNDEALAWLAYLRAGQNDGPGAVAFGEKAVALAPKSPFANRALGWALLAAGEEERGFAAFREAIALAPPNDAQGHYELGQSLLARGRFAEALPHLKENARLVKAWSTVPPGAEQAARLCESNIQIQERMNRVLSGTAKPVDVFELLNFAKLCQNYTRRYALAVRFYQEAFARDAEARRPFYANKYYAARCALGAALGEGSDAPPPERRAEFRKIALDWLADDLRDLRREMYEDKTGAVSQARSATTFWLNDSAWNAVRHPLRLAGLPPDEATRWHALWNDVRRLREAVAIGVAPAPRAK